jgi:hypothetical protein
MLVPHVNRRNLPMFECGVTSNAQHCAPRIDPIASDQRRLYLKGVPVEHLYLAVQIGEGAVPEIAVLQNRLHAYLPVKDPCDEGA